MVGHLLAMAEREYGALRGQLLPGDGLEAAAVLLCNQGTGLERHRLLVAEVVPVPPGRSRRGPRSVVWPVADVLTPQRVADIDRRGQSIVSIHSHPASKGHFSEVDDETDRSFFGAVRHWFDDGRVLGSAVFGTDGRIDARVAAAEGFGEMYASVVGEEIRFWHGETTGDAAGYRDKQSQTFGTGTVNRLRAMRAGVVGCSGTGSIMAELLARNGVGVLVLVDDDAVEEKNLNRLVNGTIADARSGVPKVRALEKAIARAGLGTKVYGHRALTDAPDAVAALVDCDVLFGCVDTAFGRYHLECIASAYLIPYFDVGVRLEADGQGGIQSADAVSHYVHPRGAGLLSRGVYDVEQVRAENLRRMDPSHYARQRRAGYLADVDEDRPAVMSLNMQAACLAFNDFIARLHGFRLDGNAGFATQRHRLVHGCYETEPDCGRPHPLFERYIGSGDTSPLVSNNLYQDRTRGGTGQREPG